MLLWQAQIFLRLNFAAIRRASTAVQYLRQKHGSCSCPARLSKTTPRRDTGGGYQLTAVELHLWLALCSRATVQPQVVGQCIPPTPCCASVAVAFFRTQRARLRLLPLWRTAVEPSPSLQNRPTLSLATPQLTQHTLLGTLRRQGARFCVWQTKHYPLALRHP